MTTVRSVLVTLFTLWFLVPAWSDDQPFSPVTIKHMVVFGNAHSDTGNTRELFDELAGRKKPSRLRQDIRYHGPDVIDAASSLAMTSIAWVPIWYYGWDFWLDSIPVLADYTVSKRLMAITGASLLLNQTGLGHILSRPLDLFIDRSQILLNAILWLYPSIGLPVLPPGKLYDKSGRFTNGSRVWAEVLAKQLGLDPDKQSDFVCMAYAGSHVRQRLSEDDMISFSALLANIDMGMTIASTLFKKGASSSEREGFWGQVADNMTPEGQSRFKNLLKDGIPPSFEFMVEDYGDRSEYADVREPESTLYVISYGADDYVIDEADPQDVIDSLRDGIEKLIARDNAQHFLITELQDPLQFPSTRNFLDSRKQDIQEKVNRHNDLLEDMIGRLMDTFPSVAITLISDKANHSELIRKNNLSSEPCLRLAEHKERSSPTHTVLKIPSMSKKTQLTDTIVQDGSSLSAASRFIGRTVARCNKPNQYYFYDGFNLTDKAHSLIAGAVCRRLEEQGYKISCRKAFF
ncbi:SGNH/GDSL hydrolase family protein [Sansalvadorimonas sp. 2012CJ34-2]|uniref:SGNH/GDSL hydrolase family protein n=1 Tax=Parendozoicomonas callyspongiae TaxID=2942213 RepID=A0ABT0PDH6_9GAMM|nr:SGNH/GDSL hydrolase family protein [Sansalvadorimonas sp. 2012CJ34-2]MCL6268603.1 SGNH/GDSL hydrolase family protein [Sansalvadorimonas sp. 2012CJ34-2]